MPSGHFRRQTVALFAQQLLALVIARSTRKPPRNRRWGYLRICQGAQLRVLFFENIGTVDPVRAARYHGLAIEKILRLAKHPGHQSSWQSRNRRLHRWGGAIAVGDLYLSFSGLPDERADETVVILLACRLGILDHQRAMDIARLSRNTLARKLLSSPIAPAL